MLSQAERMKLDARLKELKALVDRLVEATGTRDETATDLYFKTMAKLYEIERLIKERLS